MSALSKLARFAVPAFSLTLLAGYVIYSQVTPNSPPPDPFALSTEAAALDSPEQSVGNDLRIISSKVINQPVFSARKITWGFIPGQEGRDPFVPLPLPYAPQREERVGTWLSSYEMTGMAIDPLKRAAQP